MTTPTPDFLRNLAAAERMVAEKFDWARHESHGSHEGHIAVQSKLKAAAFDALADEMEG